MKHFILEWKSLLLTYFTQQQDKAVDELVQPANSKAPAQPPTGSGPVITNTMYYLSVTAKNFLLNCYLSRAIN